MSSSGAARRKSKGSDGGRSAKKARKSEEEPDSSDSSAVEEGEESDEGTAYNSDGGYFSNDEDVDEEAEKFDPMVPEIPLNMLQISECEKFCRSNHIVMAAVNFLINYLKANGITATMDLFGVKHKLSPALQKVFDVEWAGTFTEEFVWDAFLVGVIVTNLVPSNVLRGEYVPMCISRATFCATMIERFGRRREYRIYPLEAGINTDMYNKHRDAKERKLNSTAFNKELQQKSQRDKNVKVYVMYPPFSNGNINSPLSTLLDQISVHSWSWQNFGSADYQNAHPTWAIERAITKADVPDVLGTTEVGENGIEIYQETVRAHIEENEDQKVQNQLRVANTIYERRGQDFIKANPNSKENPNAMIAPFSTAFTAPSNHNVTVPTLPQYNPHLSELDQMTTSAVARVLGIPAQLFSSDVAVHAANADLAIQVFMKSVMSYQKKILLIFQDLFDASYAYSQTILKLNIMRNFSEQEKKRKAMERFQPHKTGASSIVSPAATPHPSQGDHTRFIASHGKPGTKETARDPNEPEKSETSLKIAISKALGINFTRQPAFGAPRPAVVLKLKDVKMLVDMGIKFKISVRNSPITNLDVLWRLWKEFRVLGYDQLIERVADATGIDEQAFLSYEQYRKQIEEEAKIESKLAEDYPNAEQQQKQAKEDAAAAKAKPGGGKPSGGGGAKK